LKPAIADGGYHARFRGSFKPCGGAVEALEARPVRERTWAALPRGADHLNNPEFTLLAIFDPDAFAADAFEHAHSAAASGVQQLADQPGLSAAAVARAVSGRLRFDDCFGTGNIHGTLIGTPPENA
jgi:hypothetical protein